MSEAPRAVALRELELADAERMLTWMQLPDVAENIGLRSAPTMPRTLAWIAEACARETISSWAIIADGAHVGNVVLDQMDGYLQSARLSIYLGESPARGRGIGASAIRLAVERGFTELGLHRIWLTVHERNTRAVLLYTRLGFRLEGILRDDFLLRGERVNALIMSLLHTDSRG